MPMTLSGLGIAFRIKNGDSSNLIQISQFQAYMELFRFTEPKPRAALHGNEVNINQ